MNDKLKYAATKRPNQYRYDYQYLIIDSLGRHFIREHLDGFNGTPMDEYHGTVVTIPIPHDANRFEGIVNGEDFDEFLQSQKAKAFFQDVSNHLEIVWNGSNHVGRFTKYEFTGEYPDPLDAEWLKLVSENCSYLSPEAGYWEASDWFSQNDANDFGITAKTTDEEIEAIAKEQEEEALEQHDVIIDDVESFLLALRDDLIEEA